MNIQKKTAGETLKMTWDFTAKLGTGETVTGITSFTAVNAATGAVSADLTFTGQAAVSPLATALVAGGVAGTVYVVSCKVTTSLGQAPVVEGAVCVVN